MQEWRSRSQTKGISTTAVSSEYLASTVLQSSEWCMEGAEHDGYVSASPTDLEVNGTAQRA